jgi:hypothetical protein
MLAMKYTVRVLAVGLLLGSLAGCSDSPEMLFHDLVVFWNEMADTMLTVNDEETAKQVMATRAKQFKARADVLKNRIKNNTNPPNGALNKTEKQDYNDATLDYIEDLMATNKRLTLALKRLDAVIATLKSEGSATANLEQVRGLPCTITLEKSELAPGRFDVKSTSKQVQMTAGVPSPCVGGGGGGFGGPGGGRGGPGR